MNIKIITNESILFNGKVDVEETTYDEGPIIQYDDREIKSLTFEFREGIKVKDTADFEDIQRHPEWVETLILKIR